LISKLIIGGKLISNIGIDLVLCNFWSCCPENFNFIKSSSLTPTVIFLGRELKSTKLDLVLGKLT